MVPVIVVTGLLVDTGVLCVDGGGVGPSVSSTAPHGSLRCDLHTQIVFIELVHGQSGKLAECPHSVSWLSFDGTLMHLAWMQGSLALIEHVTSNGLHSVHSSSPVGVLCGAPGGSAGLSAPGGEPALGSSVTPSASNHVEQLPATAPDGEMPP